MLQSLNKKYLACILFAAAVLLFVRTIPYQAVWDDERVYFTPVNQAGMASGITPFWTHSSGMYIPLSYSTWAFVKNYFSSTGFDPAPFHVLNILIHALNGILLFYLLSILFRNNRAAFFGGLLFLIHPLQVESVAWISEFRGLYSTFFCLIALCFFFNELNKNITSSLFISKRYWLAFIFYLLALLAKPSGIVLPLLILALCRRFYTDKFRSVLNSLLIWLIPAAIIIFLLLIKNPEIPVSIGSRFLVAGFTLLFYLQKIVFPYPLVACYGYTPTIVTGMFVSYAMLITGIVLFVFLFFKRRQLPTLFTSFLIIIICLLPVLGFIPFVYQQYSTVADRYVYMAMMGPALMIAALVIKIKQHAILKYAGILLFPVFIFLTLKQTSTWKDEFTLWNHNLKFYTNNATVYYDRGVQYSLKGDFRNALDDYTHALSLDPNYLNALFNRANAYENLHNPESALNDYNRYIQLDAKDGSVYYKRSYLFFKSGKLDEALDDVQRAEEFHFPVDRKYKERLLKAKFQE